MCSSLGPPPPQSIFHPSWDIQRGHAVLILLPLAQPGLLATAVLVPGKEMKIIVVVLCAFFAANRGSSHGSEAPHKKVGRIFEEEERRQRQNRHDDADAVENGPKEISIYCPVTPQVRIVDLTEDQRDQVCGSSCGEDH